MKTITRTIILICCVCMLSCGSNTKSTDANTTIATQNKASVKAFFKALEAEDINALMDLFADNAQHSNPYHSNIFPEGATGKAAIKAYWAPVFPNFGKMSFPIEALYAMENPNMIYVKYSGHIALKDNAGTYSNAYYSIFTFNDSGKIIE